MQKLYALALAVLAVPAGVAAQVPPQTRLPLHHAAAPTSPDITAADLMTRLYIFADDSMQGREAGTAGNVKGTDYIAHEIEKMGLVPAGDDGTYFQTIPLKVRTMAETSSLTVDGQALALFKDFVPMARASAKAAGLAIVYGGEVGGASSLTADQAAGKLVVLGVPAGAGLRALMRSRPEVPGAAAVAVVALDNVPPRFMPYLRRPQTFVDDASADAQPEPPLLLVTREAAARMLGAPLDGLAPGTAGKTAALDVQYTVEPVEYPARNVVGIVRGSDPALAGEYVAIGAHNDHIGMTAHPVDSDSMRIWNHVVRPAGADDGGKQASPAQQTEVDSILAGWRKAHPASERLDSISNGADDDGSGTVSALEVAQKIASLKQKPKRSILFVWHVGEEKGLLGSRYYTDHPTVPRDSIVAQLNMDMVGRGDATDETGHTKDGQALHGDPNYLMLVGSRRLSTELGDLIEKVNTEDHHNLHFDYSFDADGHPANIYCRSDHYEYARYGIPITFFTTGLHSDYHQVTDEPQYIDYPHMARIASLVEDVAVHVADMGHRPVVDHPKPDPQGACRQ